MIREKGMNYCDIILIVYILFVVMPLICVQVLLLFGHISGKDDICSVYVDKIFTFLYAESLFLGVVIMCLLCYIFIYKL